YKCDTCQSTFESYSRKEFERHQLKHELEATEPPGIDYICFECDASFDLASSLIKHASKVHQTGT
ncbi:hypothetical protein, partial [Salmonella sp. s54925]|uniref:hypothetical protein n=1 Tax=Salmonella sp. s54925 TaxID=3159674 RepID=UPI0039801079